MSSPPGEWYRDNYLVSTAKHLIQPEVVNDAFASDSMYWVRREPIETVKKLLSNSLCFGLYVLPESSSELAGDYPILFVSSNHLFMNFMTGRRNPTQIGLARLVTDEVTFAYLTDVFVLEEYRGKGLGMWMMECMNEVFDSWPDLRCAMLMTSSDVAKEFYKKKLGMTPFHELAGDLEICWRMGPGSYKNH